MLIGHMYAVVRVFNDRIVILRLHCDLDQFKLLSRAPEHIFIHMQVCEQIGIQQFRAFGDRLLIIVFQIEHVKRFKHDQDNDHGRQDKESDKGDRQVILNVYRFDRQSDRVNIVKQDAFEVAEDEGRVEIKVNDGDTDRENNTVALVCFEFCVIIKFSDIEIRKYRVQHDNNQANGFKDTADIDGRGNSVLIYIQGDRHIWGGGEKEKEDRQGEQHDPFRLELNKLFCAVHGGKHKQSKA